jgi:2-methylisocitrate lyase-like PEP mutase family enzyme
MEHIASERISWKQALKKEKPLLMPVAHDGLSAKLIERAGFNAVQVGGLAVAGARHGLPGSGPDPLRRAARGRERHHVRHRPADPRRRRRRYGDVKNVTHTVRGYMALGIQGLFIEDQQAPKECGHMDNKRVVPVEQMVAKIKAAVAAREQRDFFILARTDAIDPEGVDAAIKRGEKYLKAGADGIYVEGPTSEDPLPDHDSLPRHPGDPACRGEPSRRQAADRRGLRQHERVPRDRRA